MIPAIRSWRVVTLLQCGLVVSLLSAPAHAQNDSQIVKSQGDEVVATIGDQVIRMRDLERHWQTQDPLSFARLQQQVYEARKRALDELIGERLLDKEAKKREVSVDQLVAQVLPALMQPMTDAEINEVYDRSPAATQGVTLEQSRPAIAGYLRQQRLAEARRRYIEELRRAAAPDMTVRLQMPRQTVRIAASDPVMGPASAPVEIVEFSDFECPFCKRAVPILLQIVTKYRDQVKLVWKDFPLPTHPAARLAAEAGECANDQGRFWDYHDALFRDQDGLTPADLKKRAADVGLDTGTFDRCVESGRHRNRVMADIQQGKLLGVGATPTVFINGRMVTGVAPLETYERIILEELASSKTTSAAK